MDKIEYKKVFICAMQCAPREGGRPTKEPSASEGRARAGGGEPIAGTFAAGRRRRRACGVRLQGRAGERGAGDGRRGG